jgi:DNA-binding NtrC family response regulator
LQDFEFEQVGGNKTYTVDSRLILATNENLDRLVSEGRFRQDLFYRINVINIELPSLRERVSDIPLLSQHFLARVCQDCNRTLRRFDDDALAALQRYTWPGNVRELQNVIERAVLLSKAEVLGIDDLPTNIMAGGPLPAGALSNCSLKEALTNPERQIILDVLETNHWNRHATAEALGINRTTLYKKMKRLGLQEQGLGVRGSGLGIR